MQTSPADIEPRHDAVDVLRRHHRNLEVLLAELGPIGDAGRRREALDRFAAELDVVATIEDRLFYRRVQRGIPALADAVVRARRELVWIYRQVERVREAVAATPAFQVRLQSLRDDVRLHCRRNALDLYPGIRRSELDLRALGGTMELRANELRSSGALPPFQATGA